MFSCQQCTLTVLQMGGVEVMRECGHLDNATDCHSFSMNSSILLNYFVSKFANEQVEEAEDLR